MGLTVRQIRVYGRATLMVLLAVAVLLIVLKNRGRTADVWLLWVFEGKVSTLWLLVITAATAIIVFWVLTKVVQTVREVRKVRREARLESAVTRQKEMAKRLEEQEKRIDQKVHDSIRKGS